MKARIFIASIPRHKVHIDRASRVVCTSTQPVHRNISVCTNLVYIHCQYMSTHRSPVPQPGTKCVCLRRTAGPQRAWLKVLLAVVHSAQVDSVTVWRSLCSCQLHPYRIMLMHLDRDLGGSISWVVPHSLRSLPEALRCASILSPPICASIRMEPLIHDGLTRHSLVAGDEI